jgi:crossover junction endodeoxyribonuclease RuvC
MLILGIDPGTATTGFGVLRTNEFPDKYELVDWGWIKTDKENLRGDRLVTIHEEMLVLLKKHKPDVLAIERLFFATNVKTAMAVSESLGVIRLAAAKQNIPVFDYAPMSIKLVVGGSGKADKILMKATVRKLLSIRAPNHKKTFFDDVCDALAVAICHHRKSMLNLEQDTPKEKKKSILPSAKATANKGGEK